jgi:hypothetical protein
MSGWRERIQQAFIAVHGDSRDGVQVRASRELAAEIEKPVEPRLELIRKRIGEQFEVKAEYGEHHERAFRSRANHLSHSALRSSHLTSHLTLRRGIHQCHEVSTPVETAEELFRQALCHLEGK